MSVSFNAAVRLSNNPRPEWATLSPQGWEPTYEDDPDYGIIQTNQNPWEMNLANGNFKSVMLLLGYEEKEIKTSGLLDGDDLAELHNRIAFVLESLRLMPDLDGGKPPSRKGNVIDMGRHPGYYTDVLTNLLNIVNVAIQNGGALIFG